MHPATRSPISKDQDKVSASCALSCPPSEDRARQEFKGECDTLSILKKYGPGVLAPRHRSGVRDYDLDLQSAMIAVNEVDKAYRNLSPELRERFKSLPALMTAIANGEEVQLKPPATADAGSTTPAADGAAASPEGAR